MVVSGRAPGRRSSEIGRRAGAVALGLAVDAFFGEPPARVHPVACFGRAMTAAEERWWADGRATGVRYAALGVAPAVAAGFLAEWVLGPAGALGGATALAAASRSLLGACADVARALDHGNLPAARGLLPTLVGRDPDGLDEKEIARAVIESLSENLSDAVVASALWGVIAGTPGVLAHRAANTLDAMVGHHTARFERFGWASARLDDLMGWPAARLTAALVAAATPARAGEIWRAVRDQAPAHPSPNAGVAEAAFAGALGLRLGGSSTYGGRAEIRPGLGSGPPPETQDIDVALRLARRVLARLELLLVGVAVCGWLRARRATSAAR
jgi:adenosylcobinamide-phosphate synthase